MYVFKNENPCRKKIGDCVIRAISTALNQQWERTYIDLCIEGYINCDLPIVEDIAPENVQNAPQVLSEPLGDNLPEYITKAEFEPFKTLLQKIEKELYADEPTE